MQLRCLLDTIEVEEPIGLNQIGKVVKRDRTEGSILVTQDAEVTFVGDGFDYLYNLLRNSGFCVRASCTVQITIDGGSTWTNYYEGLIPISAVEFDLKRNLAKTKIFDNSYNSKIDNSKSIGAFLYGERSRNDVAITPIPYQTIQYFSVTTGTYITQTFNGGYEGAAYRPFDVMRFLIEFMTDGEIGFASSVFDTGGEYEGYLLTHGRAIQLADQSLGCPSDCPPACTETVWREFWDKVDWAKLFKEYRNRFNLAFAVDYSTSPITLRVEKESYFRENGVLFSAFNVDEMKVMIDEAQLYSKMSFGQGGTENEQGTHFPFNVEFIGFKDEEFQVVGTCNIDSGLDIKTDFITNTNDVEYLVVNGVIGTEDWDREIFIIDCEYDSGINWKAKQSQFMGNSYWFYNESLTNASIAQRFLGAVPNSIASFIEDVDVRFLARHNPGTGNYAIAANSSTFITFGSEVYDPSNSYDGSQFFVPPRAGIFTFKFEHFGNIASGNLGDIAYFRIERYDSTFTTLLGYTYLDVVPNTAAWPPHFNTYTGSIAANSGDKICISVANPNIFPVYIDMLSGAYGGITRDTTFSCIASSLTQGEYQFYDPENIPIYKNIFSYPMSVREMDAITSNPKGLIEFSRDGGYTKEYGWIDTIKHTPSTGIAQITLTSTKNLNKNGH